MCHCNTEVTATINIPSNRCYEIINNNRKLHARNFFLEPPSPRKFSRAHRTSGSEAQTVDQRTNLDVQSVHRSSVGMDILNTESAVWTSESFCCSSLSGAWVHASAYFEEFE